jgi:hypothetical protein
MKMSVYVTYITMGLFIEMSLNLLVSKKKYSQYNHLNL